MNKLVPIGATILLLAALGAGAVAVGSRPSTTTPTPAPTAPAAVQASTSPGVSVSDFVARRDAVCKAASALAEPVRARYQPLYDNAATAAQKDDAIAGVRDFVTLTSQFTDELAALEAPPQLVAEHAANVANYRDILILIRESLALHDAGKTAEALAVDLATNGIAAQINAYEGRLGLIHCP